MGKFHFDNLTSAAFDDRELAHLQVVIVDKLRRGEAFSFTWKEDISTGGGRSSVWLHPSSIILFRFHGSRRPHINMAWVEALAYTANQPAGLYLVPEPPAPAA